MYSYEDPHNAELTRQATEIFSFFTGSSSEQMNKEQFRKLFLSSGEEIASESEFDGLFAEVDGNDRDAKISLEEFIEWFKKDDSYEYSMRTKPLRDMKERLKTPAFYRSLQYFMGKNPGSNASNMHSDNSMFNIDLGFKIGKMVQQTPAWGFDLKFETVQTPAEPGLVFEFTYKEGVEFQEISSQLSQLASIFGNFGPGIGPADLPQQITIEGHPGVRLVVPLSTMHPVVMMAPMFMSIIKDLHVKLHTSQSIDEINTDTVILDAGFKFQGQRGAFQMFAGLFVETLGVDQRMFSALTLMKHINFSLGFESLDNVLDGKLKHQFRPEKIAAGKRELSKFINRLVAGLNLQMPINNLHKIELRVANNVVSFVGINFDVSFIFDGSNATVDTNINTILPSEVVTPIAHITTPKATEPVKTATPTIRARAIHDFASSEASDLKVKQNQWVVVRNKQRPDGCWECELDGKIGLVPASYLQEIPSENLMRAIADHYADQPEELSVLKGDIIIVRKKNESGWWECEKDGRAGWVPATFLETLPNITQMQVLYDYNATGADEMDLRVGQLVYVLQKNDSGWWSVEKDGRVGLVPGNYLGDI